MPMTKILKIRKFWLILILTMAQVIHSAQTLAVLEIVPTAEDISVTLPEMRHLSDELRRQAVQALPSKDYAVLTRDNMFSLLPTDEAELECLAESCAVEIGRAIGAEYVSQGKIGYFGGDLSLSIELYETMGGKLLGSIVMESPDIKGLMNAIRTQAPGLFAKMNANKTEGSANLAVEEQKLNDNSQLTTINSQQEKKSNTSLIVAISLDAIGAAALGFGIYQQTQKTKYYDDYKKMPEHQPKKDYDKALQKAKEARTMRNVGYAVGGALLAAGIAVHIWF